jgi:putative hemolysin
MKGTRTAVSDQAEAASLTTLLLDETIQAMGLPAGRLSRALIRPLVYRPANRFARLGVIFVRYMANGGFPAAARWALESHQVQVRLRENDSVPSSGPLLVTSNHPGGMDCLALAAGLGRSDLKIVASGMPFLRNLPEVARHLILVSRVGAYARMSALRESIRHLEQGGALLIFPRGRVEPDPAFFSEAESSMEKWSPSVRILLDSVPRLKWMVAVVSGVVSNRALEHPFARRKRELTERQLLAEFYQIARQVMSPRWFQQTISLSLAPASGPAAGAETGVSIQMADVVASARRALLDHWAWIRAPLSTS